MDHVKKICNKSKQSDCPCFDQWRAGRKIPPFGDLHGPPVTITSLFTHSSIPLSISLRFSLSPAYFIMSVQAWNKTIRSMLNCTASQPIWDPIPTQQTLIPHIAHTQYWIWCLLLLSFTQSGGRKDPNSKQTFVPFYFLTPPPFFFETYPVPREIRITANSSHTTINSLLMWKALHIWGQWNFWSFIPSTTFSYFTHSYTFFLTPMLLNLHSLLLCLHIQNAIHVHLILALG